MTRHTFKESKDLVERLGRKTWSKDLVGKNSELFFVSVHLKQDYNVFKGRACRHVGRNLRKHPEDHGDCRQKQTSFMAVLVTCF